MLSYCTISVKLVSKGHSTFFPKKVPSILKQRKDISIDLKNSPVSFETSVQLILPFIPLNSGPILD